MAEGHNSGNKNDPLLVMGKITGRFDQNPMKTARGVEETIHTIEKMTNGYNFGQKPVAHNLGKI